MLTTSRLHEHSDTAHRARDLLARLPDAFKHVTSDSRTISPLPEEAHQTLFLAYPGVKSDGRAHIDAVVARGAAVIAEADGFAPNPGRSDVLAAHGVKRLAGHLAAEIYAHPCKALWMIGVTGTNGKTSCTQWLAQAFALLGKPCGVIGTLGAGMPNALRPNPNTTPDATLFHAALRDMLDAGAQACAAEVTSIGLMEGRVNGAAFNVALMTNLTHDHLDYHGTFAAYAAAKQQLFTWPGLQHAVLNWDDGTARGFARALPEDVSLTSFSSDSSRSENVTLRAQDIRFESAATCFTLVAKEQTFALRCPVIGAFNVSNLLGVAGVLLASGVALEDIAGVLPQLTPPSGRMEIVGAKVAATAPLVVVDYAHTPDALQQALVALRPIAATRGGTLAVVFGCGGNRDATKRAVMGEIAARHADRLVLTNDNPRSEDSALILATIAQGVARVGKAASSTPDRAAAIAQTIAAAHVADVILIAGKGHESTQTQNGVSLPFSDQAHARAALGAWRQTC